MFTISVAGGQSKPALPQAQINLVLRASTGAFGAGASNPTLIAKWSDVGFGGTASWPATHLYANFSTQGSVNLSFAGFVDNGNSLFGAGTPVGTTGPLSASTSSTVIGPGPANDPFSMSESMTATFGANSSLNLAAFNLTAVPPPLTLACPSASGNVGVAYDSHVTAGGGIPPYTFSTTGSLPPGLGLNPSTGEITGTPTTGGTYPFTAQARDTSGNSASNTMQTSCSITITTPPAPMLLACPTSSNQEGTPYSSSLVAMGGSPSYSFFITSGNLPPGFSLNPSTGAITGTDTTAEGQFPFTAKAVDSAGHSATQLCMIVEAAPPKPAAPCELYYTTDDAKTFVLNWTFDAAATNTKLEEVIPTSFANAGVKGQTWTDLKTPGTQTVNPTTARSYNLTFKLNGSARVCQMQISLPSCVYTSKRNVTRNNFQLNWATQGTTANGMTFDPEVRRGTPLRNFWPNGASTVKPDEDSIYTLTVTGRLPKDSRKPQGDSVAVTNSCDTAVSPLTCTISTNPEQVVASAKAPAKVKVTWDAANAIKSVLQRLVNGKLTKPANGDPANPQNDPPQTQDINVTATTDFVLSVTAADNARATCSACVLNRPEKGKVLDIPPLFQRQPMWCWLTVGEMIFKFKKPPVAAYNPWKPLGLEPPPLDPDKLYQWGIMAVVHPQCWLSPNACAAVGGGSWQTLQDMLAKYPPAAGQQNKQNTPGIGCQQKPGCLSADEIKREIDAGRPIIAGITPGARVAPPVPAHVALIIGYIDNGNGDIDLIVNDPWPYQRLKQTAPYTQFGGSQNCDANYTIDRATFCSKAAWGGSLINIQ
jgi:hypothetical protein